MSVTIDKIFIKESEMKEPNNILIQKFNEFISTVKNHPNIDNKKSTIQLTLKKYENKYILDKIDICVDVPKNIPEEKGDVVEKYFYNIIAKINLLLDSFGILLKLFAWNRGAYIRNSNNFYLTILKSNKESQLNICEYFTLHDNEHIDFDIFNVPIVHIIKMYNISRFNKIDKSGDTYFSNYNFKYITVKIDYKNLTVETGFMLKNDVDFKMASTYDKRQLYNPEICINYGNIPNCFIILGDNEVINSFMIGNIEKDNANVLLDYKKIRINTIKSTICFYYGILQSDFFKIVSQI